MISESRRHQIVTEAWAVVNELMNSAAPLKINSIILKNMTEEERTYFYEILEKRGNAVHLGNGTWGIRGAKYDI